MALGSALLVGCTSVPEPAPTGSEAPAPEPDADAQVRLDVAAGEAAIIGLYDAVLAAYPGLADDLAPLREEHLAHAAAMGDPIAPSPGSTDAGPADVGPTDVGSQPQALAALIDAEQKAVAQRTSACETSSEEQLARTIALIAASEAGHAEFLRRIT